MAASHDCKHNNRSLLVKLEGAALFVVGADVDGVRLYSYIEA